MYELINLGRVNMSDPKINNSMPLPGISTNKNQRQIDVNQRQIEDDTRFIPQQFKDVAASMEQQFVEIMLDQMGKTINENEESANPGMDFYKSIQKSERAKIMTAQNNLGLQNMVLEQIYPKRLRNEMALKHYEAQNQRINQNLPSYKIDRKTDNIEMRQNDSTSSSEVQQANLTNETGGSHE